MKVHPSTENRKAKSFDFNSFEKKPDQQPQEKGDAPSNMSKELKKYRLSVKYGPRTSNLASADQVEKKKSLLVRSSTFLEGSSQKNPFKKFITLTKGEDLEQEGDQEFSELPESSEILSKRGFFRNSIRPKMRTLKRYKNVRCVIFPDDLFRKFWNVVINVSIFYAVAITPLTVAFPESFVNYWNYPEYTVDGCFILDVLFNLLFFVYFDENEELVISRKKIMKHYLTTWFFLDITAAIPLNWIFITSDNVYNYARYMKLPRLYRIFRLTRLLKIIREKKGMFIMAEFLKIPPGFDRLLTSLFLNLVIFHVISCLWILIALLEEENTDNWIFRLGYLDEKAFSKYIISYYWTVQTVFTVGYGDISAVTWVEKMFANFWMICGVFVYSFTIGSITSMLSALDTNKAQIAEKMVTLAKIRNENKLPKELYNKAKEAIRIGNLNVEDYYEVVEMLPPMLKTEMMYHMHREIVSDIDFFQDKPIGFIAAIGPRLKLTKFSKGDIIFNEGDPVDEIYFIKSGGVAAVIPKFNNFKFMKIQKGYYFGEIDIYFEIPKRPFAFMANKNCELLVLHKKYFNQLFNLEYKEIGESMQKNAQVRKSRMEEMHKEAINLLESFQNDTNKIKLSARASIYKSQGFLPGQLLNSLASKTPQKTPKKDPEQPPPIESRKTIKSLKDFSLTGISDHEPSQGKGFKRSNSMVSNPNETPKEEKKPEVKKPIRKFAASGFTKLANSLSKIKELKKMEKSDDPLEILRKTLQEFRKLVNALLEYDKAMDDLEANLSKYKKASKVKKRHVGCQVNTGEFEFECSSVVQSPTKKGSEREIFGENFTNLLNKQNRRRTMNAFKRVRNRLLDNDIWEDEMDEKIDQFFDFYGKQNSFLKNRKSFKVTKRPSERDQSSIGVSVQTFSELHENENEEGKKSHKHKGKTLPEIKTESDPWRDSKKSQDSGSSKTKNKKENLLNDAFGPNLSSRLTKKISMNKIERMQQLPNENYEPKDTESLPVFGDAQNTDLNENSFERGDFGSPLATHSLFISPDVPEKEIMILPRGKKNPLIPGLNLTFLNKKEAERHTKEANQDCSSSSGSQRTPISNPLDTEERLLDKNRSNYHQEESMSPFQRNRINSLDLFRGCSQFEFENESEFVARKPRTVLKKETKNYNK